MRKLIITLLLLFTTLQPVFSQPKHPVYSNSELAKLAKTWGYLKYYHPVVSQGKVAWDSLLLATLNRETKTSVAKEVSVWLEKASTFRSETAKGWKSVQYDSVDFRNFNLGWINKDSFLNQAQKEELIKLSKVTQPIGNYYSYSPQERYGLANEKTYSDSTVALRLLGLFRFWNAIEYFYPYKYTIGKAWDRVLKRFIPLTVSATTPKDIATLNGLLAASLNDTHAVVNPAPNALIFGKSGPPFKFKVVNNLVVITKIVDSTECAKAGLAIGDLINKINGQSVKKIIADKSRFISSSNESVKIRDAFFYLFNGDTDFFEVSGQKKAGKNFTTKVKRIKRNYFSEWDRDGAPDNKLIYYDYQAKKLVYYRILEGNIGYIERSSIAAADIDSMMHTMKNTKGIIFDLRGYNNDGNGLKLFDYFLLGPVMYGIKTQPDFNKPGTFLYRNHIAAGTSPIVTIGKNNPAPYQGKVVCLINEATQSAEEMWAMLFKTIPNVTFIGSQTAGADGNMTPVKSMGSYQISMSGLGIFYPNGKETQRIGIIPDVLVKPTIKDMQAQKDVLVEKAIELINSSIKQ